MQGGNMINQVSFKGADESAFKKLVNSSQAFPAANTNAASKVGDTFEKKHSKLKKAGIVLGAAAAIVGALALGHKTNISEKIPLVGKYIDNAGEAICNGVKTVVSKVRGFFKSDEGIKDTVDNVTETLQETASNSEETVKNAVEDAAEEVSQKIEKDIKNAAEDVIK